MKKGGGGTEKGGRGKKKGKKWKNGGLGGKRKIENKFCLKFKKKSFQGGVPPCKPPSPSHVAAS